MYKNIIHQIAEIAMAYDATILHNDRDFATIAKLRSPKHLQFGAPGAAGFHEPEQAPLR